MNKNELKQTRKEDKYYSVIIGENIIGWDKTPEKAYKNALLVIDGLE